MPLLLRGVPRAALLGLLVLCGVVIPLSLLLMMHPADDSAGRSSRGARVSPPGHARRPLDLLGSKDAEELRSQIRELERIRASVRNELREMEQQRNKLNQDLQVGSQQMAKIHKELDTTKVELVTAKGKLSRAIVEASKKGGRAAGNVESNPAPIIILPSHSRLPDLGAVPVSLASEEQSSRCTVSLCFDFSRCPLTQPFRVYLYNQHLDDLFSLKHSEMVTDFVSSLQRKGSLTSDPSRACVFILLIGPLRKTETELSSSDVQKMLHSLSHWNDGINHVLINLSESQRSSQLLNGVSTGRAIVAQSHSSPNKIYRAEFDVLAPPITSVPTEPVWRLLPSLLPATRENLIYFQGKHHTVQDTVNNGFITEADIETLREALKGRESISIETKCNSDSDISTGVLDGEWALCGTASSRFAACSQSTFALVIGGSQGAHGAATYSRLVEALRCGAIPVVLGVSVLPFDAVIDWSRAAIVLPAGRFPDVHYVIRSMDTDTILQYRLRGRFLWKTYFSSPLNILDSIAAIVRYRAGHPPPPVPEYRGRSLHAIPGELRTVPSPSYQQNFSTYTHDFWNSPPGPFYMYSLTPFKPVPVSGKQYVDLNEDEMLSLPSHVVQGGGITGPVFESYLLGNYPEEHFTVVMLTYQRNDVLVQALNRLKDVTFLAKVVVVWNNEEDPPSDMLWPEIGVPVEVVQPEHNSLNNRFLPFSNIETEAILSIDDDVHLRPDEIQFGFRVWREARDQLVGFPGRFHSYDVRHGGWLYNSNYSCELSMVLTGAAFFHKYYAYLYTYWMPHEVRDTVDKFMNCEDIAMNFLISHIRRKTPLKVTTRWTFRCPGCTDALSASDEHFNERHICINTFTRIFGYIPLLYTQFRADSVLFKTRLPGHLNKCYEYV